jgi:hypothetical protein
VFSQEFLQFATPAPVSSSCQTSPPTSSSLSTSNQTTLPEVEEKGVQGSLDKHPPTEPTAALRLSLKEAELVAMRQEAVKEGLRQQVREGAIVDCQ